MSESEALSLAQDFNTSPEKLIELLSENGRDHAVVSAIAVHPNMTNH